jgi:hypothetical protein
MATRQNHQQVIEWLDSATTWLAHRADLVGGTRSAMTKSVGQMTFRAPAGDRVRQSTKAMATSFASIERELQYLSRVCRVEADRLRQVDVAVTALYAGLSAQTGTKPITQLVPLVDGAHQQLQHEVAQFEADPNRWVEARFAPEVVDETPTVESVDPDEPAVTELGTLDWSHGSAAQPRCVPRPIGGQPIHPVQSWPPTVAPSHGTSTPLPGRYEMDIESMRVASTQLTKLAAACQDHQAAITRHLSTVPHELRAHLRQRFEHSRRACSLGLERSARRLSRQAALLRTRATTPGLVDGAFNPHLAPIGQVPKHWHSPMADRVHRPSLGSYTDRYVTDVNRLNHVMTRLARRLPVIYGLLPVGWWKPVGYTNDVPPKPIWGNNVPADLLGVAAMVAGAPPTAARTPGSTPPGDGEEPATVSDANQADSTTDTGPTDEAAVDVSTSTTGTTDSATTDIGGSESVTTGSVTTGGVTTNNGATQTEGSVSGMSSGTSADTTATDGGTAGSGTTGTAHTVAGGGSGGGGNGGAYSRGSGGYIAADSGESSNTSFAPTDSTSDGSTSNQGVVTAVAEQPYRSPHPQPHALEFSVRHGRPATRVAAGGAVVGVGGAGGVAIANKKARSRISDWASYVKRKGVLSKKGGTPP